MSVKKLKSIPIHETTHRASITFCAEQNMRQDHTLGTAISYIRYKYREKCVCVWVWK
jgi:hypothetical protein